jgi:hypothetical protein
MSDDFYHDDPIEKNSARKFKGSFLTSAVAIIATAFFFQTTLASDISINLSKGIEFGQGVSVTAACAGATNLTLTPNNSFTNASNGGGAHYLSSITLSGIPAECNGADFIFSAYDSATSSALPIFGSSKSVARIWSNAGTFQGGSGSSGSTVSSTSGSFTVSFTVPAALANNVAKITVQSGLHVTIGCIEGGVCALGDIGPGGGNIFYVSSGFDCGPSFTNTGSPTNGQCHYLEAAPKTWDGGTTDGRRSWTALAPTASIDISGIPNDATVSLTNFGLGYKNSIALASYNSSTATAGGAARAYTGGSLNDWYLPSSGELHQLIKWAKGLGASDSSVCGGTGSLNTSPAQGFVQDQYFSSSEYNNALAWSTHPAACGKDPREKDNIHLYLMRPIRAF